MMVAVKKDGFLIEPITEEPSARWEGHHATNPTVIRLTGDSRVFLGYRAGGDDDLYFLGDQRVWSSHLGLAVLDERGETISYRFPLPVFTIDKDRHLPKSPEEFGKHIQSNRRNDVSTLHDFRFWEDQDWLYVIYHEGTVERVFDCIVRMKPADFVSKIDESVELLDSNPPDLESRWRAIWWRDDVWEPCGVNGTNRIYPSQMAKNDIVHLRLNDGTLLMYHRPAPDIAVLRTEGAPYPSATDDGITTIGHLQSCIRPGYRDNSHIGNNGAPITVQIGRTAVALDVPHGVYNEALSDDTVTQKWKLLYYPYLRLLDLDSGQCLYYSDEPILTYDGTWESCSKYGTWVSESDHLDGVMFAGGTVAADAAKNGLDDLFRSYIGIGDTAIAVAGFRLREMLPEAVVDDIVSRGKHRETATNGLDQHWCYLDDACGWRWSLANDTGDRTITIRRELETTQEHEDRPIDARPGCFDADCLSFDGESVVRSDEVGWIVAYTGSRWTEVDGEKATQYGTGIVVLDRQLPERILYRSEQPIDGSAGVQSGWVRTCVATPLVEKFSTDVEQLIPARVRDEIKRLYKLNPFPSDMIRWLVRKSQAASQ